MYTLHLNSDAGYAVLPLTLLGAPVNMVTERDGHASARDRDKINTRHTHTLGPFASEHSHTHTAHRAPFDTITHSI